MKWAIHSWYTSTDKQFKDLIPKNFFATRQVKDAYIVKSDKYLCVDNDDNKTNYFTPCACVGRKMDQSKFYKDKLNSSLEPRIKDYFRRRDPWTILIVLKCPPKTQLLSGVYTK